MIFNRHHERKNQIGLVVTVAALALSASACGSSGGSSGGDSIKVGAVLSLSGPVAPLGQAKERGIKLAVKEINAAGGIKGKKLVVKIVDDQSDQDVAATSAQRLITQERVTALLGADFGSTATAVGAIAEKSKVPLITGTGVAVEKQRDWKYNFFALADFKVSADAILKYLSDQGRKNVALFRLSREYGQLGSKVIHELAPKHGIKIVAEEQGADGDASFSSQLTKIRSAQPDAMVVWFANPAGATVVKNMAELGMNIPAVAPVSMENRSLFDVAGASANGLVVQGQLPVDGADRSKKFVEAFKAEHKEAPLSMDAVGYDLVHILSEALKSVDDVTNAEQVHRAIESVSYHGAATIVKYGPKQHEPDASSIVLTKVQNGAFVAVDK